MNTYLKTLSLDAEKYSDFLTNISDEIDIPDSLYEEATVKYEEVGVWLADEESELAQYSPEIYPQGSFRLGTVVKPVNAKCDYDIDLVCRLDLAKEATSQRILKHIVGKRLQANPDLAAILSPSRRCWNLDFPKQFHMDVLPSIANQEQLPDGILLTDTELTRWQKSNPKEYSAWFYRAMLTQFQQLREKLAKSLEASIEDVPEWRVKTPLQQAVQLLKRHRDIMFQNDLENRPVSIIITTLAAHAYGNQDNVADALMRIASDMPKYIENRNGKWWVENPVERDENFADKWNEKPERLTAFLKWLTAVQRDVSDAAKRSTLTEAAGVLSPKLGAGPVNQAENRVLSRFGLTAAPIAAVSTRPLPKITTYIAHCQAPIWPSQLRYKADVKGELFLQKNGRRKIADLANRKVHKKLWIKFSVQTNAPRPYTVHWQVVNTGPEASTAGQLRGDFYDSDASAATTRWETTSYSGTHWVEAFIVKDGVCVARSGRKYVNVA